MKPSLSLFCLLTASTTAFVVVRQPGPLSNSFALSSTLEEAPPTRVAPDAGYEPEWEDRPGLSPEEFMQSDMNKPDLSGMWECPLTRWDPEGYVR